MGRDAGIAIEAIKTNIGLSLVLFDDDWNDLNGWNGWNSNLISREWG